jgi:hypothetical protein
MREINPISYGKCVRSVLGIRAARRVKNSGMTMIVVRKKKLATNTIETEKPLLS